MVLGLLALLTAHGSPAFAQSSTPGAEPAPAAGQAAVEITPAGRTLVDKDFGKQPTYIKADTLTLKSEERFFTYSGNVEVRQGDMTLTSDIIDGRYGEDNRIRELIARSNVTITKGADIRATGQRAIYDQATQTVTLTESPELQQNDSILTADSIRVLLQENRSVAEGSVRVKLVKKGEMDNPEKFLMGKE